MAGELASSSPTTDPNPNPNSAPAPTPNQASLSPTSSSRGSSPSPNPDLNPGPNPNPNLNPNPNQVQQGARLLKRLRAPIRAGKLLTLTLALTLSESLVLGYRLGLEQPHLTTPLRAGRARARLGLTLQPSPYPNPKPHQAGGVLVYNPEIGKMVGEGIALYAALNYEP
eukprot:scaffold52238_cov44-Phaeocystis_antarctica.AAC.2